jgi:hypothetical protein
MPPASARLTRQICNRTANTRGFPPAWPAMPQAHTKQSDGSNFGESFFGLLIHGNISSTRRIKSIKLLFGGNVKQRRMNLRRMVKCSDFNGFAYCAASID